MDDYDFYQFLCVPPSASIPEISRAYRRLAKQHHPDLRSIENRPEAEMYMKKLNEAYEVLRDPARREEYDRQYSHAFSREAYPSPSHSPLASTSHSFGRIITLGLDMITVAFLMVGGYFLYVVWNTRFDEIMDIFIYPNEYLMLVVWWFCIGRMAFRLIPFRR
jgi:curved DNA-binding protein CbpA